MVVRQERALLKTEAPALPVRNTKAERLFEVRCPHCRATRDFLTPDGVVMLRVLEDATDVDLLEEGRLLLCDGCGGAFKCPRNPVAA